MSVAAACGCYRWALNSVADSLFFSTSRWDRRIVQAYLRASVVSVEVVS